MMEEPIVLAVPEAETH